MSLCSDETTLTMPVMPAYTNNGGNGNGMWGQDAW